MISQETLEKLKTLSERGMSGEKENAAALLNTLCKKYGVNPDEIGGSDKIETHWFKLIRCPQTEKLLMQCAYKAIGKREFIAGKNSYRKRQFAVECTAAQAIEIELDYGFYAKLLNEEVKRVYDMFIQANKIFPPGGPVSEEDTKLDEQDIRLYQGLRPRSRTVMIEGGENNRTRGNA